MNKKTLGYVILLGSVWGLAECGLGIGLKACAASLSGSVMTAVALFFIATAYVSGRKFLNVALAVAVAILFKTLDALMLGLPLGSTEVVHPAFAFVLEGAAFVAVGALVTRFMQRSHMRGVFWGGMSALISAAAFPLVKAVSWTSACVVPGSNVPTAWAYAPVAMVLSMLTVPLALGMAEKALRFSTKESWRIPAAVALCAALMAFVRGI